MDIGPERVRNRSFANRLARLQNNECRHSADLQRGRPVLLSCPIQRGSIRVSVDMYGPILGCDSYRHKNVERTFVRLSTGRLSAYSRLFSSTVLREMASNGCSTLFARLLRESLLLDGISKEQRVRDAFEAAFAVLRTEECRDEYVYKTALSHKVLLGTHSLNSACMLTEFRVGECKADLAILNGTATAYEIKSERDSLSRLAKQLEAYKKVFARVVVIAGQTHVDMILKSTSSGVGVMGLSNRYQLTTLREPEDSPERICPLTVLDAIRANEATEILRGLGVPIPNVPNTKLRLKLGELFAQLHPADVHREMVRTLKRSRDLAPLGQLVNQLPPSLHAASLSIPLRKADHIKLVNALNTELSEAVNWA